MNYSQQDVDNEEAEADAQELTSAILTSVQLIRAIELLTKARDQVGLKLYQEIHAFLTGLKEGE